MRNSTPKPHLPPTMSKKEGLYSLSPIHPSITRVPSAFSVYPNIFSMMKSSCAAPGATTYVVRGCACLSVLAMASMLSISVSPPPPQIRMSLTMVSKELNQSAGASAGWL